MRRPSIRSRPMPVLAWILWMAAVRPAAAETPFVEGYPSRMSVTQLDTLRLHVRGSGGLGALSVWRQGRTLERLPFHRVLTLENRPVPADAWENGCGWPVTTRVEIPEAWPPGAYLARVDISNTFTTIPFVVRARTPGSSGPILVQLSTATWQAYNRYGGKSLYGSWAPGLTGKATRVSYHRPYDYFATDGSGQLFLWEAPFLSFLESEGYRYEVCTNTDLHENPGLLDAYRLFVSVGHDEYYSKEMFDELERYVDAGGALAFLSANTLWWQVRFEDSNRAMVCYKDVHLDPLRGIDDSRVTVNWHAPPVLRPPARLMGVYFNGSWGIAAGGFHVVNPAHWVFRGIPVAPDQAFGYPMVAFEVDSRTPDSPPALDLIARTELPDANNGGILRPCEMVYYERTPAYGFPAGNGGRVFASGTVNFAQGLVSYYNAWTKTYGRADPVARAITRNVLDELGCSISAPLLLAPLDNDNVMGTRSLFRWQRAATQRDESPVTYRIRCEWAGGRTDSVDTKDLFAWIPNPVPFAAGRWQVQAAAECGGVARSAWRHIGAGVPSDASDFPPEILIAADRNRIRITVSTPVPARGALGVYDVAGRIVYRMPRIQFAAGANLVEWNLRDHSQHRVRRGIYIARLQVGRTQVARKFSVLFD